MDVVAQRGEFGGKRADLLTDAGQVGLGLPAQRLDALAFGVGGDERAFQGGQGGVGGVGGRRGHRCLAFPDLPAARRGHPRGTFVRGGTHQRVRAAGQRPRPLLAGAHGEPGLDLLGAHGRGRRDQPVAFG